MRSELLDTLAEGHSDCLLVAYADISIGITLRAAGDKTVPREALDEMCAEAALTLGAGDDPVLGQSTSDLALKSVENAIFVFLRAPDEPGEALIAMCRDTIALDSFLADARAAVGDAT